MGNQESNGGESPFSVRVELGGRDQIEVSGHKGVSTPKVHFKGCTELMELMKSMRTEHGDDIRQWPMAAGVSHAEILLRELQLKLSGQWNFPFNAVNVCNCRHVPTAVVDQAVISGAHTTAVVSRQTAASTNCGTCRPDVQKIIDFRLGKTAIAVPAKKTA